jgi:hypothetical protein
MSLTIPSDLPVAQGEVVGGRPPFDIAVNLTGDQLTLFRTRTEAAFATLDNLSQQNAVNPTLSLAVNYTDTNALVSFSVSGETA